MIDKLTPTGKLPREEDLLRGPNDPEQRERRLGLTGFDARYLRMISTTWRCSS